MQDECRIAFSTVKVGGDHWLCTLPKGHLGYHAWPAGHLYEYQQEEQDMIMIKANRKTTYVTLTYAHHYNYISPEALAKFIDRLIQAQNFLTERQENERTF